MSSEPASADWNSPTVVTGERVSIERKLSRKNENEVIATIEVTAEGGEPVGVEVFDVIPPSWQVSDVGVHPRFKPKTHEADPSGFRFSDTVDPEAPLQVVYGVRIGANGEIEPPDAPVLEREWVVEEAAEAGSGPLDAGGTPPEAPPAADLDAEAGPLTRSPSSAGDIESAESSLDRARRALNRDSSAVWADKDRSKGGSLLGDREPREPDRSGAEDPQGFEYDLGGSSPPDDDRDVVEELAAALESGDASASALETIREAVGGGGRRRDEVRVNHLQSRVEEFAAYADTLGKLIDEHGDLEPFLSDQAARVESLEDDLEEVHGSLNAESERRRELADRLDGLADRIDRLEGAVDDLEGLRHDVKQLRSHHGDDVNDLESAINAIERQVEDATAEMNAELDALATDLDRWESTRRRLADALVPEHEGTDGR